MSMMDWDRGEEFDDKLAALDISDAPEVRTWKVYPEDYSGEFETESYSDDLYEWETNEVYADLAAGEYDDF
jgi:hypothetical protein